MRTIDVVSAPAAAENHGAATSPAAAEAAKPSTGETSTCGAATPRSAAARSASTGSPAAEARTLFPTFAHSLVEFVGAHAEHTDP